MPLRRTDGQRRGARGVDVGIGGGELRFGRSDVGAAQQQRAGFALRQHGGQRNPLVERAARDLP